MADTSEHGVIRPHHQRVLAGLRELTDVVQRVALQVLVVTVCEAVGDRRVHLPRARFHIRQGDDGVHAFGVLAVLVEPEDGVEDLHRGVGVQRRIDLRDHSEIAIDELADTDAVFHRTESRAPRHEQLELGHAEGVLAVDQDQRDTKLVCGGSLDTVGGGPSLRLDRPSVIRDPPYFRCFVRIEMRW